MSVEQESLDIKCEIKSELFDEQHHIQYEIVSGQDFHNSSEGTSPFYDDPNKNHDTTREHVPVPLIFHSDEGCNNLKTGYEVKQEFNHYGEFSRISYQTDSENPNPEDFPEEERLKDPLDVEYNIDTNNRNELQCDFCGKCFQERHQLKKHEDTAHKNFSTTWNYESPRSKKLHQCNFCNYTSNKTSNMKTHVARKHGSHKCHICKESFNRKYLLNKHVSEVHESSEGEKKFRCDQCDGVFNLLYQLNTHINDIHNGNATGLTNKS